MKRFNNTIAGITVTSLLVLAGCGDTADRSSSVSDDTSSPTEASGLVPPRAVNASTDPGTARDPGVDRSTMEAGTAVADLSMSVPWRSLRFEFAPDLVLPDSDTGFVYPAVAAVDPDEVITLARALGVGGDLVAVDAAEGGGWRVGPGDGSAPSLQVAATGQLDWWYSPAWESSDVTISADECVMEAPAVVDDVATEPTAESIPDTDVSAVPLCESTAPEPPANVPDAEEARRLAADYVAAAGLDTSGTIEDIWADEWSANVTYAPGDPSRPPTYLSFGFGADGALMWASGSLGEAEPAGPYPLVDLPTAIGRVEAAYAFDVDNAVGDGADPLPVDPALVDPIESSPIDGGEMIDRVVTVTSVSAALWAAWDGDGSIWYVPAYEFRASDESTWIVPAITDEFLVEEDIPAAPSAPVEEPAPPAPAPTDDVVELPDSPAVDDATFLIGLDEADADAQATAAGWSLRVIERDGEPLPTTMDYRPDRVNVAVEGGVVTKTISFG